MTCCKKNYIIRYALKLLIKDYQGNFLVNSLIYEVKDEFQKYSSNE